MKRTSLFFVTVISLLSSPKAWTQGVINFNDFVSGVVFSHVYGPEPTEATLALVGNISTKYGPITPGGDFPAGSTVYHGTLLGGAATGPTNQSDFTNGFLYTAQLWSAPGFDQPETALQQVAQYTTTLRTGPSPNAAGFITPLSFTAENPDPGILSSNGGATCQLRVWYNGGGAIPDWYTAQTNGVLSGASPLFDVSGLAAGGTIAPSLPVNVGGLESFNIHLPGGAGLGVALSITAQSLGTSESNAVAMSWLAATNQFYQMQFTTNLASPHWTSLGGQLSASNGTITITIAATNAAQYYRVFQLP